MTFKSCFCNENSIGRWSRQPGPLRDAAGFTYQEFSNLEQPLALKDDPWKAGAENKVMYWAEFLMPDHAQAIAYYDHPFFGHWPAITRNQYGSGTLVYEGTFLSDTLQKHVLLDTLKSIGMTGPDHELPAPVHVKQGVNDYEKRVHFYLNYSSNVQTFNYPYSKGTDLFTGHELGSSAVHIAPWDLVIIEEQ
jgi:beta-galactosidase